jgi:hypothetical protein
MLSKEEAEARVMKGATKLDAANPGWPDQIDVGVLDLANGCRCICGQLGWNSEDAVALHHGDTGESIGILSLAPWPHAHTEYRLLQDAWIAAIAARKFPARDVEPALPDDAVAGLVDEGTEVHSR